MAFYRALLSPHGVTAAALGQRGLAGYHCHLRVLQHVPGVSKGSYVGSALYRYRGGRSQSVRGTSAVDVGGAVRVQDGAGYSVVKASGRITCRDQRLAAVPQRASRGSGEDVTSNLPQEL